MISSNIPELINREMLPVILSQTIGIEVVSLIKLSIHEKNLFETLFEIALHPEQYSQEKKQKQLEFHAAWVVEQYYFSYKSQFTPFINQFCEAFPQTTNESTKRHFCKIMNDLLKNKNNKFAQNSIESIVRSCAEWIMLPKTRIAVCMEAIEIVEKLRNHSVAASEIYPILLEKLQENGSPALWARMKKWNKESIRQKNKNRLIRC